MCGIPIYASVESAFLESAMTGTVASHLVIGLAPDGGLLSLQARKAVKQAIRLGLHVDSGLHDFLSEDKGILNWQNVRG